MITTELVALSVRRPVSVMASELMGWNSIFALSPYSEAWRERRKLFTKYFRSAGPDGVGVYTAQTYEFVHRFLVDVNETPAEVYSLARQCVALHF